MTAFSNVSFDFDFVLRSKLIHQVNQRGGIIGDFERS
jgi:hypothetical protein